MAVGLTIYSQISDRVNDIINNSLAVARSANLLGATVTMLDGTGLAARKVNEWNELTWAEVGDDDDTAPQQFTKDALATIQPKQYRVQAAITDAYAESDFDQTIAQAELELGSGAAKLIDTKIATLFSSAGNSLGTGVAAIDWDDVANAYAILNNKNIPATSQVFCALHPYQWVTLLKSSTTQGSSISVNEMFSDRIVGSPNFYQVPDFQGVTFVISNDIAITDGKAYGCMYVSSAFAVDMRKGFEIEPERDASRELTELNARMWFGHSTWRSDFAVYIYKTAATPS